MKRRWVVGKNGRFTITFASSVSRGVSWRNPWNLLGISSVLLWHSWRNLK